MKPKRLLLAVSVALVSVTGLSGEKAAKPTELSRAAAAMKVGEWRELKTGNLSRKIFHTEFGTGKHLLNSCATWANKLHYDPVARVIPHIGAGHGHRFQLFEYSEASNAWSLKAIGEPSLAKGGGHTYNLNTMDDKGVYYHMRHARPWQPERFYMSTLDVRSRKWKKLAVPKAYLAGPGQACLAFFKPLGAIVHLKRHGTSSLLGKYDLKTGQWLRVKPTVLPTPNNKEAKITGIGSEDLVMVSNDVHKLVLFGGGQHGWKGSSPKSKVLYQMDKDLKVARLPDAPAPVSIRATSLSHDPVSGDLLVVQNGDLYSLDLKKDHAERKWVHHKDRKPPFGFGLVTPIPKYGISFYLARDARKNYRVYLYKHAEKKKS